MIVFLGIGSSGAHRIPFNKKQTHDTIPTWVWLKYIKNGVLSKWIMFISTTFKDTQRPPCSKRLHRRRLRDLHRLHRRRRRRLRLGRGLLRRRRSARAGRPRLATSRLLEMFNTFQNPLIDCFIRRVLQNNLGMVGVLELGPFLTSVERHERPEILEWHGVCFC